jgi:hypothetical protein
LLIAEGVDYAYLIGSGFQSLWAETIQRPSVLPTQP